MALRLADRREGGVQGGPGGHHRPLFVTNFAGDFSTIPVL